MAEVDYSMGGTASGLLGGGGGRRNRKGDEDPRRGSKGGRYDKPVMFMVPSLSGMSTLWLRSIPSPIFGLSCPLLTESCSGNLA